MIVIHVLIKIGQYKDSLTDEKFRHTQPSLIDCLTAKGFDLLAYSSARPERSGSVALDEGQWSLHYIA